MVKRPSLKRLDANVRRTLRLVTNSKDPTKPREYVEKVETYTQKLAQAPVRCALPKRVQRQLGMLPPV